MAEFTELVDLAAERVGGKALAASDEFFAEKENLLKPGRGVFIADKYTDRGKWMDGWESRRKRVAGYDWCILRLGMPGIIRGVDIDTNHFTGNHPESASFEACEAASNATVEQLTNANWVELVARGRLQGGSQNLFAIASAQRFTHVRLNIYPDGGVARLRVHGEVLPDWPRLAKQAELVDLLAVENGGRALVANDMYFSHKDNLIMPGPSLNMGDGWETKRKRGPGYDWVILQLGHLGTIEKIEVDTSHFKGNYPDRCSIDGARVDGAMTNERLIGGEVVWAEMLPSSKLEADRKHVFAGEIGNRGPFTHVRLNIYPDGGVARLRLYGRPANQPA